MAVFAGGQVLLGRVPDYYVIDWLPIYNLILGAVSVLFASVVIWRNGRLALPTSAAILGLHAAVMLLLLTAYRQVVAVDSLRAMSIRLAAWTVILILPRLRGGSVHDHRARAAPVDAKQLGHPPLRRFLTARSVHGDEADEGTPRFPAQPRMAAALGLWHILSRVPAALWDARVPRLSTADGAPDSPDGPCP